MTDTNPLRAGELGSSALAQPEPGLTSAMLLARADGLIPVLRAQQEEAEERGYYSAEILDRFRQAGFYRMYQPKLFGGYEFDSETFLEVVYRIATGHPSSGWCFCLSATHVAIVASHFPPEVQWELIGPDGEFRAPHRAVPGGTIVRVDGGYRVDGTWRFSSGIPVSTHFIGNSLLIDGDAAPKDLLFVVPREEITILDDWGDGAGFGMQASGSNAVRIDDLFVPEGHVIEQDVVFGRNIDYVNGTPGTALHGNPFYLGVMGGLYQLSFAAVLAGTARAAVEEFSAVLEGTHDRFHGTTMADDPDARRALGKAAAMADASHAIMVEAARANDAMYARWADDHTPVQPADVMRVWALARQGASIGADAVQLAFRSAGPSSARKGSRLQRYLRDSEIYRMHGSTQPWVDDERGNAELGRDFTNR